MLLFLFSKGKHVAFVQIELYQNTLVTSKGTSVNLFIYNVHTLLCDISFFI